ncbi:hypothetical protein K505DRAFT_355599 [Melanomma pulvis-pyrius CBS 109.77]|uniref:Uncharacterized protein n=1 Tax=Melanomma pulvis-pyrius CBS 109.77 TaxID=1314802 RepID=A0A6A6XWY2_9PLEO|nr:hypothetical protein K505DRAFT_355599 [Melanomma pulvis-pyrius CBS 109.77]
MPAFKDTEMLIFPPAEMPGFPSVDSLTFPSSPVEIPAFLVSEMPDVPYPPSPPASAGSRSKSKRIITYLEAANSGNVMLCLPRGIRSRIYALLLADYPELRNIEVPETRDFAKTFPEFCHSLDMIYFDTCLLMIKSTTFTISSDSAIFNLMVFLDEFPGNKGYDSVQSLEFAGRTVSGTLEETALSLFEKGKFNSNATELLRRCPNVKEISLVISLDDLPWTFDHGGRTLNIVALTDKYDIASITALTKVEVITLSLKPFMALEKIVRTMEEERKTAQMWGWMGPGLDGFWGLKAWFEEQGLDQMRLIDVRCPSLDQLV